MKKQILIIGAILFVLMSCKDSGKQMPDWAYPAPAEHLKGTQRIVYEHERANSIYHWKTTFNLDDGKDTVSTTNFLKKHSIKRMYIRFFDVDLDWQPMNETQQIVPIGTTVFNSGVPDGIEVVPTVFITVRAMADIGKNRAEAALLAKNIYTRVVNMMSYNELGKMREIQIDCDWNKSTRVQFYFLAKELSLLAHEDSVMVSATIRLHQLFQTPPPVDSGVLMVYNTGTLLSPSTKNSILDYSDVALYLSNKEVKYDIPLDFAFPIYRWGVLFRKGKFLCILREVDFEGNRKYRKRSDGTYIVEEDHTLEGHALKRGDVIRVESPSAELVDKVARLVTSSVISPSHSIILYHLDSKNISKYSTDEIANIYNY